MKIEIPGEKARKIYDKKARPVASFAIVENRFSWKGAKNKVEEGLNIVVSNHPGAHKDIASLIALYLRQLSFLANQEIFTQSEFDKLIRNYVKEFCDDKFKKVLLAKVISDSLNLLLTPIRLLIVNYISPKMADSGTIPVSIRKKNGNSDYKQIVESYLLNDLAVVFMQHNKNRKPSSYDPRNHEIREFTYGAPKAAYDLLMNHDINVPVTPISIKGTSGFWFKPFGQIKVNIGEPMFIKDYLTGLTSSSERRTLYEFKNALEKRVVELYHQF
ncbi:hypothetical protein KY348_02130 [Candidatus Woesearchaeota archaeon]|nr:hypothetical protein [Candidatus Woesearchaeota archaeon]